MAEIVIDDSQLKKMLKQTIIEIIREDKTYLAYLMTIIVEYFGLTTAINEGKEIAKVEPELMVRILDAAMKKQCKHEKYDFSDLSGKLTLQGEPLGIQEEMRNAW